MKSSPDPRQSYDVIWSQALYRAGQAPGLSSMTSTSTIGPLISGVRLARERQHRALADQARTTPAPTDTTRHAGGESNLCHPPIYGQAQSSVTNR
ncbi:MAG: hypothetical protein H0X67_08165 [Acidobacteria bacterium]|nr:hypothetical protein [Acidobacteriota bacterium]